MADAAAGIGEALPCFGNELPLVRAGLESELEDTEGRGIAYFTRVSLRIPKAVASRTSLLGFTSPKGR